MTTTTTTATTSTSATTSNNKTAAAATASPSSLTTTTAAARPPSSQLRCRRCGYPWHPREPSSASPDDSPGTLQCASCGSLEWDAPGKDGKFSRAQSAAFSSIREAVEGYLYSGADAA